MQQIAATINDKFKSMSFVCACFVCAIHVFYPAPHPMSLGGIIGGVFGGSGVGTSGIALMAVPFFFFVSGYYLSAHMKDDGWWRAEVVKRIRTILIPFVVWSGILICYYVVKALYVGADVNGVVNWRNLARCFGLNPLRAPVGPYWFLRSLFLIVVFSPLLKRMANVFGMVVLFLLYAIVSPAILSHHFSYSNFFRWCFSLEGCFYFSLGIYIRDHKALLNKNLNLGLLSLITCIVLFVAKHLCWMKQLDGWYYLSFLAIPFAIYAMFQLMPERCVPVWLSSSSFPLYMLHWPIMDILRPICVSRHINALIYYVLALICCFAIVWCLRRLPKQVARVLLGGR